MRSLTETVLTVHSCLAANQTPHALCGGVAANLYRGEVRATEDVDFCIAVGPAVTVDVAASFRSEGWSVATHGADQLRLCQAGFPPVYLLIASTDFQSRAVEQAVKADIEGVDVPVLRAEDLAVFKLVAGRARDFDAVGAMVRAQQLDTTYIQDALEELGLADRWALAVEEADRG